MATFVTLAGYGTTLMQQVVYARVLGVGAETDALAAALAWATGVSGLIGTTFISVMVPAYARQLTADPLRAARLLRTANALAVSIGLAGVIATLLLAGPLASTLLPGSQPAAQARLASVLRDSSPLLLLWILVATSSALATVHERYAAVAGSTIAPSLVVVAVLLPGGASAERAALGYVAGAVLQVATLLFVARPWLADLVPLPSTDAVRPLARRLLLIGAAFLLINAATLVIRGLASLGTTGDAAVADYASRLVNAAESALLSGALSVVLTTWSLDAEARPEPRLRVGPTLCFTASIVIPACIALALFAPDIVGGLFGGGRFTSHDVQRVAGFLQWLAPGVAAHMFVMVGVRAAFARGATWSLLALGGVHLIVLILAGLVGQRLAGANGIAAAYSLAWFAGVAAVLAAIRISLADAVVLGVEIARALGAGAAGTGAFLAAVVLVPSDPGLRLVSQVLWFGLVGLVAGHVLRVSFVRAFESEIKGVLRGRLA